MSFKDGDFIKIEYDAWRAADNSLIYTTDEKKARENNIFEGDARYGPQLVIIGKKNVISGLDSALKGMSMNEEKKVALEPKDAFGDRKPELVKLMPISEFKKRDIAPYPGMRLNLDGSTATVRSVNSGRVLVDENHPLAGERLVFQVRIVEEVKGEREKIAALADYNRLKSSNPEYKDGKASIELKIDVKKDPEQILRKTDFVDAAFSSIDSLEKIVVKEEYSRDKEEKGKGAEEAES